MRPVYVHTVSFALIAVGWSLCVCVHLRIEFGRRANRFIPFDRFDEESLRCVRAELEFDGAVFASGRMIDSERWRATFLTVNHAAHTHTNGTLVAFTND